MDGADRLMLEGLPVADPVGMMVEEVVDDALGVSFLLLEGDARADMALLSDAMVIVHSSF